MPGGRPAPIRGQVPSPTPIVDIERIVGLRVYQELGEAAVLGPVPPSPTRGFGRCVTA